MAKLNIQASPEEILLFMEISQFYYSRGDYVDAENVLRGAMILAPENPDIYACLGAVYQAQGRFDEAADCFARSLATCPGEKCARSNLAQQLLLKGRIDEAAEELRRVVADIEPDHPIRERAETLLQIAETAQKQRRQP